MATIDMGRVVVAEAFNQANDYWLLGWTWDEISSVLADSGYTEPIIAKAVSLSQDYAKKILKNGPFAQLAENKCIRLKNGLVGTAITIGKESIAVHDGKDVVRVAKDLIDIQGTLKLYEAEALRKSAWDLAAQFQHGELIEPEEEVDEPPTTEPEKPVVVKRPRGRPRKNPLPKTELDPVKPSVPVVEEPKKLEIPSAPSRELIKPVPEETFSLGLSPTKRAPSGWGEYPKLEDIGEVSSLASSALEELDDLEKDYRNVEEDLKAINEMARDIRKKEKEIGTQKLETAKKVFAIIATENKDVAEMGTKVFMRYKNSLVGLQSSVTAIENPIDAQDELSALKEILEKNYPKIASEVQMAMDQWKIQNKTIQEQLTKTLVYFTPKKEKTGQFLETISGWVNKAWESMKKLTKRLDAILFPQVDKTVAAIEAFEETTGKKKAAACIKRLVNEQYSH